MVPIYTAEKAGFKHLLKVIDSRHELPSQRYLVDTLLPHLYNTTREKITEAGGCVVPLHYNGPVVQPDHAALPEFDSALYQQGMESRKCLLANIFLLKRPHQQNDRPGAERFNGLLEPE